MDTQFFYKALFALPKHGHEPGTTVAQEWVNHLPIRMQSVLFSAIRGPDNTAKHGKVKLMIRWLRRCILVTYADRRIYLNPYEEGGGGSFMKAWKVDEDPVKGYLDSIDELPHHFQMHFIHAAEILGYRHPNNDIRLFWREVYLLLVEDFHMSPEIRNRFEQRFSDTEEGWTAHLAESHLR